MDSFIRIDDIFWRNGKTCAFEHRFDPFPFRACFCGGGSVYGRVAIYQKGNMISEFRHNRGWIRAGRRSSAEEFLYGHGEKFRSRMKSRSWKDCSKRDHQWKDDK